MAHLSLGKRVSFAKLVELIKSYRKEYDSTNDIFEKAEITSHLYSLFEFSCKRGGIEYWNKVKIEAGL